jgi:hypothetical protein
MSALCHNRTPAPQQNESLFDHLIRKLLQMQWQVEASVLAVLRLMDQLKLCRRLDREVGRLRALEDPIDIFRRA